MAAPLQLEFGSTHIMRDQCGTAGDISVVGFDDSRFARLAHIEPAAARREFTSWAKSTSDGRLAPH
jgi:hypothetical protein